MDACTVSSVKNVQMNPNKSLNMISTNLGKVTAGKKIENSNYRLGLHTDLRLTKEKFLS